MHWQTVFQFSSREEVPLSGQLQDISLTAPLPYLPNSVAVHVLRIEFFQEVNGAFYPLQDLTHNRMQFIAVV